jgi:addiction module HigA family antidote
MVTHKKLSPIHPGEMLYEEFMKPLKLSATRLAIELHIPTPRISELINRSRGLSVDTAMRLARYFGNSVEFWMNLQKYYDIETAEDTAREIVNREVAPRKATTGWGRTDHESIRVGPRAARR